MKYDEKIVILENLRFYEEEEKNENGFAKAFSKSSGYLC